MCWVNVEHFINLGGHPSIHIYRIPGERDVKKVAVQLNPDCALMLTWHVVLGPRKAGSHCFRKSLGWCRKPQIYKAANDQSPNFRVFC